MDIVRRALGGHSLEGVLGGIDCTMQYVLSLVSQCFLSRAPPHRDEPHATHDAGAVGPLPDDAAASALRNRGAGGSSTATTVVSSDERANGASSSTSSQSASRAICARVLHVAHEADCRTADGVMAASREVLRCLPNDQCRALVLSTLATAERKGRKGVAKRRFLRCVVHALPHDVREAVYELMVALPPAALGDEAEREVTRVLVDVVGDAKSSMGWQRHQVRSYLPACECAEVALGGLGESYVAAWRQQRSEERRLMSDVILEEDEGVNGAQEEEMLVYLTLLLEALPVQHLERIVLQQLLLSRHVVANVDERAELMMSLVS